MGPSAPSMSPTATVWLTLSGPSSTLPSMRPLPCLSWQKTSVAKASGKGNTALSGLRLTRTAQRRGKPFVPTVQDAPEKDESQDQQRQGHGDDEN